MSFLGIDANKSGKDTDWIEKIIFFNIYYCTNRICIKNHKESSGSNDSFNDKQSS